MSSQLLSHFRGFVLCPQRGGPPETVDSESTTAVSSPLLLPTLLALGFMLHGDVFIHELVHRVFTLAHLELQPVALDFGLGYPNPGR